MLDVRQLDLPPELDVGVDANFVPASWPDDPDPLISIDLFVDAASARATSTQANEGVAGDNPEIFVHKNVSLEISRSVTKVRRDKLVSALMSL